MCFIKSMSHSPSTLSNTTTNPILFGVSIAERIDTDLMNSRSGYMVLKIRNSTNLPRDVAENENNNYIE